jgi:hypothetical protein
MQLDLPAEQDVLESHTEVELPSHQLGQQLGLRPDVVGVRRLVTRLMNVKIAIFI